MRRTRSTVVMLFAVLALVSAVLYGGTRLLVRVGDDDEYWTQFTFEEASRAVRQHPDSMTAHAVMACHWEAKGRPADAEREWAEAVRLDPQDYTLRAELAEAMEKVGRRADALTEWRRVAATAPPGSFDREQARARMR